MNISKSGTISPCRKTKYAKCVRTDDVGDKLIKFTVVNLLTTSIECKDISMLTSTEKYLMKKTKGVHVLFLVIILQVSSSSHSNFSE